MNKTSIEWTDVTWNPIRGCSRISEGCRNCYAERMANRYSGVGLPYEGLTRNGRWTGDVRFIEEKLFDPLHWLKPKKVFVNSMSDLFHENVKDEWIAQIFAVMAISNFERMVCRRRNCEHDNEECETAADGATKYPTHTFQVLTKRPSRMRHWFGREYLQAEICDWIEKFGYGDWLGYGDFQWPLPNVWLGVSVEDQATADYRIPILLQTPAAIRFVSAEPLLKMISIEKYFTQIINPGHCGGCEKCGDKAEEIHYGIDWVITGGESGPKARHNYGGWFKSLRDQCQTAKVPFFFKQWGPKYLGRKLDSIEWNEFPNATTLSKRPL